MQQLFIHYYHDDGERIVESFDEFDRNQGESDDDYEARAIAYIQERRKKRESRENWTLYDCTEIEVPPYPKLSEEELAKVREELQQNDAQMAATHQQIREASKPLQSQLDILAKRQMELHTILRENR